jgi:hypothetical protein
MEPGTWPALNRWSGSASNKRCHFCCVGMVEKKKEQKKKRAESDESRIGLSGRMNGGNGIMGSCCASSVPSVPFSRARCRTSRCHRRGKQVQPGYLSLALHDPSTPMSCCQLMPRWILRQRRHSRLHPPGEAVYIRLAQASGWPSQPWYGLRHG